MTRDEIKLVTFVLLALLIGAVVQHVRTRPAIPSPTAASTETTRPWAKPPYVLKDKNR